jgi:hypothetical protein
LYTASEAARLLAIPAGSIRAWASSKKLWSFGLDERGRAMYDKDDLIDLRDNTHRRKARLPRRRTRRSEEGT